MISVCVQYGKRLKIKNGAIFDLNFHAILNILTYSDCVTVLWKKIIFEIIVHKIYEIA